MPDEASTEPDIEAELAKLMAQERAQVEQELAVEQAMATPVVLPVAFSVQSVNGLDGPAVVLITRTPACTQRLVLSRDAALQLASHLKRAAWSMPA